jgi:hypothetical protein
MASAGTAAEARETLAPLGNLIGPFFLGCLGRFLLRRFLLSHTFSHCVSPLNMWMNNIELRRNRAASLFIPQLQKK